MTTAAREITIKKVGLLRPFHWLRSGWQELMAHPGPSLMYGILVTLAGWAIVTLAAPHAELFSTVITGFVLVAPLIAAGIYELTRLREAGEKPWIIGRIENAAAGAERVVLNNLKSH